VRKLLGEAFDDVVLPGMERGERREYLDDLMETNPGMMAVLERKFGGVEKFFEMKEDETETEMQGEQSKKGA
jgi:hypothetical protein